MKLTCPQDSTHKEFRRESYDSKGNRVNVEILDEYGRFIGNPLDLYTGDVRYQYFCAKCDLTAIEENGYTLMPGTE
jgi:hypothetical protein